MRDDNVNRAHYPNNEFVSPKSQTIISTEIHDKLHTTTNLVKLIVVKPWNQVIHSNLKSVPSEFLLTEFLKSKSDQLQQIHSWRWTID